ncbi:heme exporter protein CcmD [Aureimonas sp. AU12]|uniref:heme exporter protein CcmD n=1 Tax=Aureimonas sp. AU12 TaxID=1638161 RepID=UPI0009E9EF23|nr:heme exporter protein CcmD [Aureimonas sp. AU12]
MAADYAAFVAAAYGMSALALVGLVAWIARDARRTKARLAELEASSPRKRPAAPLP